MAWFGFAAMIIIAVLCILGGIAVIVFDQGTSGDYNKFSSGALVSIVIGIVLVGIAIRYHP